MEDAKRQRVDDPGTSQSKDEEQQVDPDEDLEVLRSETLDERLERELLDAAQKGDVVDIIDEDDANAPLAPSSSSTSPVKVLIPSHTHQEPRDADPTARAPMSDFAAAAYAAAALERGMVGAAYAAAAAAYAAAAPIFDSSVVVETASSSVGVEAPVIAPPIPELGLSELSRDQRRAVDIALSGRTLFFTGCAGAGKSTCLKVMIRELRRAGRKVAVTATTGAAAILVEGATLHSWGGIGLGTDSAEGIAKNIQMTQRRKGQALERWKECEVLVIDECSMLDPRLFDKLEQVATALRQPASQFNTENKPFAGLQLILSGDFAQLPPVNKDQRASSQGNRFLFDAAAWRRCGLNSALALQPPLAASSSSSSSSYTPQKDAAAAAGGGGDDGGGGGACVLLRASFRQKGDPLFASMLTELRRGVVSHATRLCLEAASTRDLSNEQGVEPTRLYALNEQVDRENTARLEALPTPKLSYQSLDWGKTSALLEKMEKACAWPKVLELKQGAQVMLLKNLDVPGGLCNGSRGVVVRTLARQVEQVFNNPHLAPRQQSQVQMEHVVVVRFLNGREVELTTERVESMDANGKVAAWRQQFPLRLAWALTIHKSQGQTIDLVEVHLRGCFEDGQAYTALSRATSLATMRVVDFRPKQVRAAVAVVRFFDELEREADGGSPDAKVPGSETSGKAMLALKTTLASCACQECVGANAKPLNQTGSPAVLLPAQRVPSQAKATVEQRAVMEANKRRALEIRARKQQERLAQQQPCGQPKTEQAASPRSAMSSDQRPSLLSQSPSSTQSPLSQTQPLPSAGRNSVGSGKSTSGRSSISSIFLTANALKRRREATSDSCTASTEAPCLSATTTKSLLSSAAAMSGTAGSSPQSLLACSAYSQGAVEVPHVRCEPVGTGPVAAGGEAAGGNASALGQPSRDYKTEMEEAFGRLR